ncbi:MAG: LysR family transcriptional regulator [Archangium sp.]|nr:LysR family transcriptional regulator [Archangium sp.]
MAAQSTEASLRVLPLFLAVAEHRSFTRAAAALGLSTSAVSQAIRALEATVGTPLLHRTTRSVSVTEAGQRLIAGAAPGLKQAIEAIESVASTSGEVVGTLRLNVPSISVEPVLGPVLAVFLRRHPRVQVDVWVEDKLVDITAARFDAGLRLSEVVARDMVSVRLTPAFRFVVVGSPRYLAARGRPAHPRELSAHTLIGYRSPTTGATYRWEFERGRQAVEVPVEASLFTNSDAMMVTLARRGVGLAYVVETSVLPLLAKGQLEVVLERWAPEVPGQFLYFPSRAQVSAPLRAFIDCARDVLGAVTATRSP